MAKAKEIDSTGLVVVFYGEKGTGKRTTILNIAKESMRDIFRLDIGAMTSDLDEDLIAGIFFSYQEKCDNALKQEKTSRFFSLKTLI